MPTALAPDEIERLRAATADVAATMQAEICAALERLDGTARFSAELWQRPGGGGGISRVLQDGAVLEKAAVNVSDVHGPVAGAGGGELCAAGLSVVLHPRSPLVPTAHMNVRFVSRGGAGGFGGGADLTPTYLFEEDCAHFHRVLRALCERHLPGRHAALKRAADEYFFLPHRGEHRGVGGIFFDALAGDTGPELDRLLAFVSELPRAFLEAWLPIAERRRPLPFGEDERRWQEIRRGRYVEFNLVHDRGTRFGLETGGRTESILASLPPSVRFPYDHRPAAGTREAALVDVLRSPRDWA